MTRPRIEPRLPGPLVNTIRLTNGPVYIYIYIYKIIITTIITTATTKKIYNLSLSSLGCTTLCIVFSFLVLFSKFFSRPPKEGSGFIFRRGQPRCLSFSLDPCCRARFREVFLFVWNTLICLFILSSILIQNWKNRFETLQEKTEKGTPNDEYEHFINAHVEAAAKCIPTKPRTKYRVPWETFEVREKRAHEKTASKSYCKKPTNTYARKLKNAQNQLAGIYLKEQTEYIKNQIDKIRDSVKGRQSRIAWQTINEVSRRKSTVKAKLKATNQQERIKLWKQHFENLLGNPPKVTQKPITRIIGKQLDIKLEPFTQEELDSIRRKIKNRKAAGLDEIPPEVWKTRQFDDILLRHCNVVYNQNPIDRWMKGCILPIPKKGDLGLAKNYRGITLTSIAAKIHNSLPRNCIEPKIDKILRKNQNGFRRNRSTTSQILTIRRIFGAYGQKSFRRHYYLSTCYIYYVLSFVTQRKNNYSDNKRHI